MNEALVNAASLLNRIANGVGGIALAPAAYVPGTVSATAAAFVSGALLILIYKYTSNQKAIKRVRDSINANLLALKLFKDSPRVLLDAQGRILVSALLLLVHSLIPVAVMALPVVLLLGQLSLWYQSAPLPPGETAVVTVKLKSSPAADLSALSLVPSDAVAVETGPVKIASKREVCWDLRALEPGTHTLAFKLGDSVFEKRLAIGTGMMRTSALLPGRSWTKVLEYPAEPPFAADAPIESIAIDYPARSSWTSGADYWLIYWFVVSLLAGLLLHKVFGVNL